MLKKGKAMLKVLDRTRLAIIPLPSVTDLLVIAHLGLETMLFIRMWHFFFTLHLHPLVALAVPELRLHVDGLEASSRKRN